MVCIVDMVMVKCRARRLCPGRGARLVRRFLCTVVMVVVGLKLLLVVGITILSSSPEIFFQFCNPRQFGPFILAYLYLSIHSEGFFADGGCGER